ncbi:hypothetical protein [Burkholderia gladioli]|uniref:hypothetical protein n=1 Tax=Burkholderia gladioli TaxID=28095 RepID=UPI001640CC5E|nr:hypothetical protein [Burkholderia gladioli]
MFVAESVQRKDFIQPLAFQHCRFSQQWRSICAPRDRHRNLRAPTGETRNQLLEKALGGDWFLSRDLASLLRPRSLRPLDISISRRRVHTPDEKRHRCNESELLTMTHFSRTRGPAGQRPAQTDTRRQDTPAESSARPSGAPARSRALDGLNARRSETDSTRHDHAPDAFPTNVQSGIRGTQARQRVSVSTIPETDIVKVHVAGHASDLARVGFENIDTTHGPKDLTYLSVPLDSYTPHLAGGERVHRPVEAPPRLLREQLSRDRQNPESSRGPVAYINGSYYNSSKSAKASLDHDEAAAIGKNKVMGATQQPEPVPVPKAYASDYQSVKFPNGSTLTTGPLLSDRNLRGKSVAKFDASKADQPKYKFPADGLIKPGDLQHAEHPNPRSAINFPAGINPPLGIRRSEVPHKQGDAVRMLVASDSSGKVGPKAQGLTMSELSGVMARLGSLNQKPGPSYNLDGGASSVMGVLSEDGRKLAEVRGRPTEPTLAANFVTMEQHAGARGAARQSMPRAATAEPEPHRPAAPSWQRPAPSARRRAPNSPSLQFTTPPSSDEE